MKPTIRIAQRACEAAKARQAIVQRRGELDGRPVCPPSKVLCRECMDTIGEKLRALLAKMENRPVPDEDRLI